MTARLLSRPNSSRRGCWTCKRHHRTCDEAKPSCLRCKQYAVECEGYGAKRVAFRPAKKRNATKTHGAQNSLENPNATPPSSSSSTPSAPSSTPSESSHPSPYSPLSDATIHFPRSVNHHQRTLLKSFICDFAPLRSLSPLQNIFEEDIAPLALEHKHVRTAIVAVTSALQQSHTRASRQHSISQKANAFQQYDEAVRLLRVSVVRFDQANEARSSHKTSTEDMYACLAATYLLTWFEVVVYDPQKWVIHLAALCRLINRSGPRLWQTTFGRRLLHAVARLDCQNALSNRGRPLLDPQWYEILETDTVQAPNTPAEDEDIASLTGDKLELLAVEYCRKLHGLLGASAFLSYEWTTDTPRVTSEDFVKRVSHVLHRLESWYRSLPATLRWPGDIETPGADSKSYAEWDQYRQDEDLNDESGLNFPNNMANDIIDHRLRGRSHLQKMLLLHYYAIRVHLYHMLDPVRIPKLMRVSTVLAQKCLYIIRSLDNVISYTASGSKSTTTNIEEKKVMPEHNDPTKPSQYPSDMPISFVFAVVGVVLKDASQRKWISDYLMRLGREGIWCGYERALCLHAWWKSDVTGPVSGETMGKSSRRKHGSHAKRLIKSIPLRNEVPEGSVTTWTPHIGMGVDILYEDLTTGQTGFDRYHFSTDMQSQLISKDK